MNNRIVEQIGGGWRTKTIKQRRQNNIKTKQTQPKQAKQIRPPPKKKRKTVAYGRTDGGVIARNVTTEDVCI